MARILAVDWDRGEARCVVASSAAGRLRIVAARSVPLAEVSEPLAETAEGAPSPPDISAALRAALDDARQGRAVVLVGVDRANVELLQLTLPPAKDAELAALVAMQVLRESQSADEAAIVDFVSVGEPGAAAAPDSAPVARQVTAAVLAPAQLERIRGACEGAGLKPGRLLLRSFAAASLFARRMSPAERTCLLVNLVCDEADLLILVDGRVVFQRTVRLPEEAGEDVVAQRLSGEITRTLLVAQQGPLTGGAVDRVFVFGGAEEHQALVDAVSGELGLPVTVVDPFEITEVPDDGIPEHPGRFAALLGMVLDESFGMHAIDFLHPRRPPRRVDRRRAVLGAVCAALLAVLSVGYYVWDEIATADGDAEVLAAELKEKQDLLKRTARQKELIQAVRDWKAGEVVWLDELRELALRMPSGRDLIVLRMSMLSERAGGGSIEITGMVRDPLVVPKMEQAVRDQYHEVRSRRVQERGQAGGYSWLFESSMSVFGRDRQSYLETLADAP